MLSPDFCFNLTFSSVPIEFTTVSWLWLLWSLLLLPSCVGAGNLGFGLERVAAANCCGVNGGFGCLCGGFWPELCVECLLELLGFTDGLAKSFLILEWPWNDPSLFDDGVECFVVWLDFFTSSLVVFLAEEGVEGACCLLSIFALNLLGHDSYISTNSCAKSFSSSEVTLSST